MTSLILVAHGRLAVEAKESLEMIYGKCPQVSCTTFLPSEGLDTVQDKIIEALPRTGEVLILADLFGGTPFNAACAVAMRERTRAVEVISGMSLPLVLEAASLSQDLDARGMAERLVEVAGLVVRRFVPEVVDDDDDI